MRIRPTEPTAALAALISGNHRHLAVRARAAAMDEDVIRLQGIRLQEIGSQATGTDLSLSEHSFALFVALAIDAEDLARAFDLAPSRPTVLTIAEQGGVLEGSHANALERVVAMPSLVIVVVIAQLLVADACGIAFADAERRSMETLGAVLESSASMRKRMRERQLRAVAAILDAESGRVHWLGEHADQARFLG
jgi:hypothetical protein